jgi:hypothetical protein
VKFLFCIPLKRKLTSCIAVALVKIFIVIGPPMILQSDNGNNKFSGTAMTQRQNNEYRGTSQNRKRLVLNYLSKLNHSLRVGWRNLPTLRVGWRNLFSSCAVVSVFGYGGK